jgi:4-oxalocrotonate tautomerase
MPHVAIKLFPGKTEDQKQRLAEAITKETMAIFGSKEESISVGFEEVEPQNWREQVAIPEILNKPNQIYRKPGYDI